MASRYSIHPQIWQRLYHGPLGPAVDALVTLLEEQGYCPNHIAIHVRAAAAVSCWLERQESGAAALTPEGLERYARVRQRRGQLHHGEAAALRKLLAFLRARGVAPGYRQTGASFHQRQGRRAAAANRRARPGPRWRAL